MGGAEVHGLYVHLPFCARRCHYCDFNTYAGLESLVPAYVEALKADLDACLAQGLKAAPGGLRSVYFGGGTPTLLAPEQLAEALAAAAAGFGLASGAEVSVEANPGTVDAGSLARLRDAGFNRISFGFQAAQDRHLEALGRVHSAEDSIRAWKAASAAGFTSMSLDLMFGLSGQTRAEWDESLEWALALNPDHVSFYGLTVEPGTRFHRLATEGLLPLPGDEPQAQWYEAGVEVLGAAGLSQYEISNFAREGKASVHNSLYWRNLDTLGLGAGAWSYLGGERSGRIRSPQAYIDAVASGRSPVADSERLEGRAARGEAAMLALRMNEGISLGEWERRTGTEFLGEFGEVLAPAFRAGCLERVGERVRLTARGRLVSNEVFAALL